MPSFYNETTRDTLSHFHTNPETGLTSAEVETRTRKYGPNSLTVKDHSLLRKILEPFLDIFMYILLAALILSLVQKSWIDAGLIAVIIILDAIIFYIQQFSTDRILRNLKQKTVIPIQALRNGSIIDLDASRLVPGDIVILNEGDRIPADGRILEESGLLTNEAMLTGESEPVSKDANKISGPKKIYEQRNMVFSGSFAITGKAKMLIVATGNDTEYGRIAALASSAESTSPIQAKINKLVTKIAVVIVILAAVVFVLSLVQSVPLLESLEFTLAMIVSAVPEGLPIAIAIILALGASRMAKKKALIKEMRAIESIGIVTTIASDKTGTLTENKLSIGSVFSAGIKPEILTKFIAESRLPDTLSTDPLDLAMSDYIKKHHPHLTDIGPIHSYPFDQNIKLSGNLYETKSGSLHLSLKGAPETVLARSHMSVKLRETVEAEIENMTSRGYKVIAIASAHVEHEINELTRLGSGEVLTFEGLIAVADTLRPEAAPAIKAARAAGVSVRMITGDHWATSLEIGKKLGLATSDNEVLDLSKLGNITDDDFEELVKGKTVFARVTPEDKFRILTALKKSEVTAMTGDGVNDVPALTNAHIGIAMGSGPSIVQDAGDIVLMDDNFKNIIEAMHEGRIILTNIRRMLSYLLATNAGEVLVIVGALLLGFGHILAPLQILWINLVTDSLMVVPIGLEPLERHFVRIKPEHKDAPILSPTLLIRMLIMALTMAVITLTTYAVTNSLYDSEIASALAFTALVVMQWANALNTRALHESLKTRLKTKSTKFYLALAAAIILQILVLATPLGRDLLHLAKTPLLPLLIVIAIAFATPLLTVELHKKLTIKNSH
jgi:Ca2+-transporting ATPase